LVYISRFGQLYHEKSGNPGVNVLEEKVFILGNPTCRDLLLCFCCYFERFQVLLCALVLIEMLPESVSFLEKTL
jgi:hypothetical protein